MSEQVNEKYESKLASKCQGVARCLTYNNDQHQAAAKNVLLEAAHMLDQHAVRIHQKADGPMIVNARGKCRFLTIRERLAVWLLRGKLEVRP